MQIEKAYRYVAKTSKGSKVEGVIYAYNKPLAFSKLKKGMLLPITVDTDIGATLSGMWSKEFNKKELSRLYKTLGRRADRGAPLLGGLDSAIEYLSDPRLVQAIILFRQGIMDGQPEHVAMTQAGFPQRDALLIRAAMSAGQVGEAFSSLGEEVIKSDRLRKALNATFRMPKIMAGFMSMFVWAALVFIAPGTMAFLKQLGLEKRLNGFLEIYFNFVKLFNQSTTFSSILYFGALGLIVYYLRTPHFKNSIDQIKVMKELSLKTDHATTWNSFYMLFAAAVSAKECAQIVADAASREDTKKSFVKMARYLETGLNLTEAAEQAEFPKFVIAGLRAAESSGKMTEGLRDMVGNLQEDADNLTEKVQETAKLASILLMGVGLIVMFLLTYFPMMSSVLSNA